VRPRTLAPNATHQVRTDRTHVLSIFHLCETGTSPPTKKARVDSKLGAEMMKRRLELSAPHAGERASLRPERRGGVPPDRMKHPNPSARGWYGKAWATEVPAGCARNSRRDMMRD